MMRKFGRLPALVVFVLALTAGADPNSDAKAIASINDALDRIIVPKVQFENAAVGAVVAYLNKRSKDLDPKGDGVNVILFLPDSEADSNPGAESAANEGDDPFATSAGDDPFADNADIAEDDPFGVPAGVAITPDVATVSAVATVNLTLREMPLRDVIRYVALQTQLLWRVQPHAVVLYRRDTVVDPVESRGYSLSPEIWDALVAGSGRTSEDSSESVLEQCGVPFPNGTKATYNARIAKLTVTNTAENLARLEALLRQLYDEPKQVHLQAELIEILDPAYLADLHPGRVTADVVLAIPADKRRVVNRLGSVTLSGHTATITAGDPNTASDDTPREMLTFTPTATKYGSGVDVTLKWEYRARDAADSETARVINTRIYLEDGATVAIPVAAADPAGKPGALFLLISATLVTPDGTPLRTLDAP